MPAGSSLLLRCTDWQSSTVDHTYLRLSIPAQQHCQPNPHNVCIPISALNFVTQNMQNTQNTDNRGPENKLAIVKNKTQNY